MLALSSTSYSSTLGYFQTVTVIYTVCLSVCVSLRADRPRFPPCSVCLILSLQWAARAPTRAAGALPPAVTARGPVPAIARGPVTARGPAIAAAHRCVCPAPSPF